MTDGEQTDAALMARLRGGDMGALGELARRHQERVLAFSYRLLGDWHQAEDVAQETFLRVRKAARTYRAQAKFTTWLYRIVYNLSIDQQRRAAGAAARLRREQADNTRADRAAEQAEVATRVREAIEELADRQRRVVLLHRYEGLSHREICEVTGWSQSAVESLLVRAYASLRAKLRDLQNCEE